MPLILIQYLVVFNTRINTTRCNNGQHISKDKVCDFVVDCLDGSEEEYCENHKQLFSKRPYRHQPPVIIEMDGRGSFKEMAIEADDPCPETHFRCSGEDVYCMPVYLRCNQVKDCPLGEDELSCETVSCPGYYRCRGSSVCLHPSHVCDGWPQCPQRDDELLCNASCPSVCQCQGLAFVCHQPFPANNYPDLRYLDAEGSDIKPANVSDNLYLIYLNLAACGLNSWPLLPLYNLQHLSLSHNTITVVHIETVRLLFSLRYLNLEHNPLSKLVQDSSDAKHTFLRIIDLSYTHILKFDSTVFLTFSFIEILNLSYSSLNEIGEQGFTDFPELKHLDISGCKVEDFPKDLFKGLRYMQSIKADNYKLCCEAILPESFNKHFCFAPKDEISSCDDLLHSNFFRSFLWMIAVISAIGNAGCFLFRIVVLKSRLFKSGYNTFVTSLSLSDFLMGGYLTIIGTADVLYRGRYLWNERGWKASVICTIAGFSSLLSNEVSAFMICLITIDRFIVLRFPFSKFRFKGRSAMMATGLAWLAGFFLSALPLIPVFSHWRFYGHTGICIPLPVTRRAFTGHGYSFGVMIVFNFILFALIALGQTSIYLSIKTNSMENVNFVHTYRDFVIARRLFTVVVSDFLCWFPIGVLGLMANSGTPVPGEVNVAMAIFVLPLNSALNPFLYTFNILMEKRRKVREARLFDLLHRQKNELLMEKYGRC